MTKLAEWFNKIGPGLSNWPLSLVCFSSFVFSTQALCVKLLGLSGVGAFETMFVRGLCQTFGCVCTLLIWGLPPIEWLGETRTEKGLLALRGMFGFGGMGFAFLAIQTTTLANAQVKTIQRRAPFRLLHCFAKLTMHDYIYSGGFSDDSRLDCLFKLPPARREVGNT